MKKMYVAPAVEELEMMTSSIMATSLVIGDNNVTVDTETPGTQLDGGRRGEWGDLWK